MAGNIICSKCGQENGPEQTFCSSCGAFLEWSAEKAAGDDAFVPPPAVSPPPDGSELAGLARSRPPRAGAPAGPGQSGAPARSRAEPSGAAGAASQPRLVSPVRPGPSRQSVPATHLDSGRPSGGPAAQPAPAPAAEPTIACPACGRANPVARNFCHSCGTLLHPKPREPMARRRRTSAGRYRLLSIILLVAILLVGSFLLTRLTAPSSGGTASPSPHGLVRPVFDG